MGIADTSGSSVGIAFNKFDRVVFCESNLPNTTSGLGSAQCIISGANALITVDHERPQDLPSESTVQPALPDVKPHISRSDICVPFTDSGYASVLFAAKTAVAQSRHQLQVSGNAEGSSTETQSGIVDEDSKTLYSAATSLDPVCSRRYIQELSQDLYRSLQVQLDQPGWLSISQVMPDLVKAFAEKIGQEGHSQVHLDIMYFIHKRHR